MVDEVAIEVDAVFRGSTFQLNAVAEKIGNLPADALVGAIGSDFFPSNPLAFFELGL